MHWSLSTSEMEGACNDWIYRWWNDWKVLQRDVYNVKRLGMNEQKWMRKSRAECDEMGWNEWKCDAVLRFQSDGMRWMIETNECVGLKGCSVMQWMRRDAWRIVKVVLEWMVVCNVSHRKGGNGETSSTRSSDGWSRGVISRPARLDWGTGIG